MTVKLSPLFDPKIRKVASASSVDAEGRPVCAWCRKRLRWNTGYGYEGEGFFCNMKCAATWANLKVQGTSDS